MENGNHPAGGGDDNSEENIDVVEEVAVEAGAVTGEVHIEAESVPAGEGSGDGSTESQAVAQMDVGSQTEESQSMDDVLHDVEDVDEDVDIAENIDNVGSDFATNTTEGDNLEYEDEHNSVGEDKELETSLESPAGTGSEANFMLHLRFGCWYGSVGPINCGKFVEKVHTFSTLLPSFINRIPKLKFINRYPILILQIFNVSENSLYKIFNFSMFLQILLGSPTSKSPHPHILSTGLIMACRIPKDIR